MSSNLKCAVALVVQLRGGNVCVFEPTIRTSLIEESNFKMPPARNKFLDFAIFRNM